MRPDTPPGWLLDPGVTFLNHGSFGACPRPVLDEQQRLRERYESAPMRYLVRELDADLERARAALAELVGAPAQDIAFLPNATSGVNLALRSCEQALGAGDALLVTSHGYGACNRAAAATASARGAEVHTVELPFPLGDAGAPTQRVLDAVTERTRVAIIDHITSPTGLVLPVAEIAAELERRGVITIVDGAHAPGQVALDIEALGASFYTGNCHKWLCTPKGSAFVYVRPDRQPGLRPLVVSHGESRALPGDTRSPMQLELGWTGTDDPTPYLCIPRAIEVLSGALDGGLAALQARNRALALEGRALLLEALGMAGAAPAPDSLVGSLAALPLPDDVGIPQPSPLVAGFDALYDRLVSEHRIEVPVFYFSGSPGLAKGRVLRISAQLYNERDDYQRLAEALVGMRVA